MGSFTNFLNLFKPGTDDPVDPEADLNENFDKIDQYASDLNNSINSQTITLSNNITNVQSNLDQEVNDINNALTNFLEPAVMGVISDPAVPADGDLNVYAKKVSGRTMLKTMGPSGINSPLQPSFFQNCIVIISTNSTTALTTLGHAATSVGTISHPISEQYGFMANFASAATLNATAGTGNTSNLWLRGTVPGGANGFFYNVRIGLPDTSYGAGATGSRFFVGLSNQTMAASVGADDVASSHHCGFVYSTNRGDTNWMFATKDATTQTLADTTMPFAAEKVYDFYVYCKPMGTVIYWRIDNITDGTTREGNTSTTLPGAGAYLKGGFQLATLTTVARNIRMQRVYIESDR